MSSKFGNGINLLQTPLNNAQIQNLSGAPSSPVTGQIYFDTTLNEFGVWNGTAWEYLSGGNGTVTTVSVATANGFAGTVATPGTTPAITIQTTVTGLLKGNGTSVSAAVANTDYAPVASPTFTGTVTVPTPAVSGAAATKGYVDGLVQGFTAKYGAVACTTGSETFTIASGNVTQISGTSADGISPAVNDYVLIMNAPSATGTGTASSSGLGTAQPGNGLYIVTSNTTNLSLSRAADFSGSNSPVGAYVFVAGGTVNKGAGFIVVAPVPESSFTYGTNNVQFQQFTGAGELSVGAGLALTGNQISIASGGLPVLEGGTGATTTAGAKTNLGFASIYNSGTLGNGSSTTLTVTHNLGNNYPQVTVWDLSGANPQIMYCDVVATSTNAVTLTFGTAPASSSIRCTVTG